MRASCWFIVLSLLACHRQEKKSTPTAARHPPSDRSFQLIEGQDVEQKTPAASERARSILGLYEGLGSTSTDLGTGEKILQEIPFCGVTMIHAWVGITAAHCVENRDPKNVYAILPWNGTRLAARQFWKNPQFVNDNFTYDVGVVLFQPTACAEVQRPRSSWAVAADYEALSFGKIIEYYGYGPGDTRATDGGDGMLRSSTVIYGSNKTIQMPGKEAITQAHYGNEYWPTKNLLAWLTSIHPFFKTAEWKDVLGKPAGGGDSGGPLFFQNKIFGVLSAAHRKYLDEKKYGALLGVFAAYLPLPSNAALIASAISAAEGEMCRIAKSRLLPVFFFDHGGIGGKRRSWPVADIDVRQKFHLTFSDTVSAYPQLAKKTLEVEIASVGKTALTVRLVDTASYPDLAGISIEVPLDSQGIYGAAGKTLSIACQEHCCSRVRP